MITDCSHCGAELGPAEDPRGCLTCRGVRLVTNPDKVVAVLEEAQAPLAHWDVRRLLESNGGRRVHPGSLLVWLSNDPRNCWSGRGIYGLYRHGLLPGVRNLGSAAAVLLHAADEELAEDQIRFVLQHVGYRFQSSSIYLALRKVEDEGLLRRNWGTWRPGPRSVRPVLKLWRRGDVDAVIGRAARQVVDALTEMERRRR